MYKRGSKQELGRADGGGRQEIFPAFPKGSHFSRNKKRIKREYIDINSQKDSTQTQDQPNFRKNSSNPQMI